MTKNRNSNSKCNGDSNKENVAMASPLALTVVVIAVDNSNTYFVVNFTGM